MENWYRYSEKDAKINKVLGHKTRIALHLKERNKEYALYKQASANTYIDKRDLYDVYRLEYKMSELLREAEFFSGYLSSDTVNIYYLRIKQELEKVVNKLINILTKVFNSWIHFHMAHYGENWIKSLSNLRKDFNSGEAIFSAQELLSEAHSLQDKIRAINYAIHVCHSNGLMVGLGEFKNRNYYQWNFLDEDDDSKMTHGETIQYLTDLSEGKFIPEWERELEMRADKKINKNKNKNMNKNAYVDTYIDKRDLYDVYRLEYKMSELLREAEFFSGYLSSDTVNIYYLRIKQELEKVVNKLINILTKVFDDWIRYHMKGQGEGWIESLNNEIKGFSSGEAIFLAQKFLSEAQSLQDKIRAINYAIHVCHSTGLMVGLGEFENRNYYHWTSNKIPINDKMTERETIQYLNDLSQGKFLPEWEKELEMRADKKHNWYRRAQNMNDDELTGIEENEYESEDFLQNLPSDFQVRIINDTYTVEQLEAKDFKVKYSPANKIIFIFAKIKYSWTPDEMPYRSIVVDLDGNIVSSGFPKFFNYGESQYSEPIDQVFRHAIVNQDPNLVFTHKYDGTLIIRNVINGEIVMRTRGTLSGREFGEAAKQIAAVKYPQLLDPIYFPDLSLLFEYIGPENRIIVSYDEPDLILIGAIKHNNLQPLTWVELSQIDGALRLAEIYSLTGKNLDEINAFLAQYPELIEGLVVRMGGQLIKIKTEDYLRLHRLKSEINYSKVADIIRANNITSWKEMQNLLEELQWDKEWFDEVKGFFELYMEKQKLLQQILELSILTINNLTDNSIIDDRARKADFAQKIQIAPNSAKPFLFAAYDGKLEQILYKKDYELEYLKEVVSYLLSI